MKKPSGRRGGTHSRLIRIIALLCAALIAASAFAMAFFR